MELPAAHRHRLKTIGRLQAGHINCPLMLTRMYSGNSLRTSRRSCYHLPSPVPTPPPPPRPPVGQSPPPYPSTMVLTETLPPSPSLPSVLPVTPIHSPLGWGPTSVHLTHCQPPQRLAGPHRAGPGEPPAGDPQRAGGQASSKYKKAAVKGGRQNDLDKYFKAS